MPLRLKINSFITIAVAAAFQWFFMFTKHNPALRPVIPFGDDPYDALGSFATIINILLCLLVLWRAFRPYTRRSPSPAEVHYLRRTQAAVPLLILVALAADAVAMTRHPRMWIATDSRIELVALLLGMGMIAGGALWLIRAGTPKSTAAQNSRAKVHSAIAGAFLIVALAIYPEHLINRLSTHLLTILIGDLLLFIPAAALLRCVLPDDESAGEAQAPARHRSVLLWAGVTLVSLSIGVSLFAAEMTEGGGPPPPIHLRIFVAAVYIGLTIAGALFALAFLKRPLGLDF